MVFCYSDIDLDANEMETEYQASFEELIWFINLHLANTGQGDFDGVELEIIFNRDMLISESEIITNIQNSVGILSEETLIAQHPWVDDPLKELERVKNEKAEAVAEAQKQFGDAAFNPAVGGKETVVTEEYQSSKV